MDISRLSDRSLTAEYEKFYFRGVERTRVTYCSVGRWLVSTASPSRVERSETSDSPLVAGFVGGAQHDVGRRQPDISWIGHSTRKGIPMSLIYRAVWNDDGVVATQHLLDQFVLWCRGKGFDQQQIPERGRIDDPDNKRWIDVRRAEVEYGSAVRCTLQEADNERVWTTTATALSSSTTQTFWIDLELHNPDDRPVETSAPRLVRELIANGVNPMRSGVSLSNRPQVIGPGDARKVFDALSSESSTLPVIIFSADNHSRPEVTIERAEKAAGALCGIARVFALSPAAGVAFEQLIPAGFHTYGGAVRVYLPKVNFEDPTDSTRHRWFGLPIISKHPRRAASLLARHVLRLGQHADEPDEWESMSSLLRRPTEEEIEARKASIVAKISSASPDEIIQERARSSELAELLAIAEIENEQFRIDLASTKSAVYQLEFRLLEMEDDNAQLRAENRNLNHTIRAINNPHAAEHTDPAIVDPNSLDDPSDFETVLELARVHLALVSIPDGALRDVEVLEATAKGEIWASDTWKGLLALHNYASDNRRGVDTGGFYVWCQKGNGWSEDKLTMKESDTVVQDRALGDKRIFPVDPAISATGTIEMEAHLKIQKGGGSNIPRLYFLDDSRGATGKIHVGFIGPHYLVPNTKS